MNDLNYCAKLHLLRIMQRQSFVEEIEFLENPKGKKVPDLVNNLNLFLDKNNLIRSDGRIGKVVAFEYDVIHPILLPKKHQLTKLIIEDCHLKCQHLGISAMLNKVRLSGFWIPKARQAVKNVISPCCVCKRFNSLSFKYPRVTNFPKHRVNFVKPFRHLGIDYTGHVWVKDGKVVKKFYLLVFTCLNVRAVYIDLVPEMSTNHFILAFIRFTNLYGIPSHIYSDNARSFIAGCNFIEEVFLSPKYNEHFSKYNIKHIPIPAYSAWVGSVWERMIRVIKDCLYKAIGRARLTYFRLITVISDIQNAINSRPLTYRCSSDSGLEIISPNCFIRPLINSDFLFKDPEASVFTADPPSRKVLIKSLQDRDKILEDFRSIYYEEYLLSLREQCKDLHQINFSNKIKIDDVVLVKGPPSKKRPNWVLGRVEELVHGSDNLIRSVKLKMGTGYSQHHSIKHLYPMELALTHAFVANEQVNDNILDDNSASDHVLPSPDLGDDPSLVTPEYGNPNSDFAEIDMPSPDIDIDQDTGNPDNRDLTDFETINVDHYDPNDMVETLVRDQTNYDFDNTVIETPVRDYGIDSAVTDVINSDVIHPSGRPRRNVQRRGRPLDHLYEYY